jgi:uncharacterized protein YecE (DUF72 family)
MLAAAAGLGSRLGPVLLQFPPTLPADPALLGACSGTFTGQVTFRVARDHVRSEVN